MALLAPLGALADTKHVYNLQDFLDAASDKSFNEIVLHTDIDLTGRDAVHFAANDPGSQPRNVTILGGGNPDSADGTYSISRNDGDTYVGDGRLLVFDDAAESFDVKVEEVTLSGGNGSSGGNTLDGGALYVKGKLEVVSCTLENNTAYNGGAIYVQGDLAMTGSLVSGNESTSEPHPNDPYGGGGGAFITGDASMSNSVFESNHAGTTNINNLPLGGGAFVGGKATLTTAPDENGIPTGVTFNGNTADGDGGGLYIAGLNGETSQLTGAIFTGNEATNGEGGGVYNRGDIIIDGGTAFGLEGDDTSGNRASHGGGIAIMNSHSADIANASFHHNSAAQWGGAIMGTDITLAEDADGNGVTIADNTAKEGGGLIAFGDLTLSGDVTLENNHATGGNGGAACVVGTLTIETITAADGSVTGATIANNSATAANNATGGHGGGIYVENSGGEAVAASITGAHFEGNSAIGEMPNGNGGAVYAMQGEVHINGGGFEGNSASWSGGAVYAVENVTVGKDAQGEGAVFHGNAAGSGGGGIATWSTANGVAGTVNIDGGTFTGNTATHGGAVSSFGDVTIGGGAVFGGAGQGEGNHADGGGGALYVGGVMDTAGNLIIGDATFTGNTSSIGGAIMAIGDVTTTGTTFVDNKADMDGGAIYGKSFKNIGGDILITDSTFAGNADGGGTGPGGAIYAKDSTVTLEGEARFGRNSSANDDGVGILCDTLVGTPLPLTDPAAEARAAGYRGKGNGTLNGTSTWRATQPTDILDGGRVVGTLQPGDTVNIEQRVDGMGRIHGNNYMVSMQFMVIAN